MEHWQLAVILLAAVLVGALIPACIALAMGLSKAGKEITELGKQLKPTLGQLQLISARVERLSRGFDGGEKNIAEMLGTVGDLSHVVQRNMKLFHLSSTVVAAMGPAIAAFIATMTQPAEAEEQPPNDQSADPDPDLPRASSGPTTQAG
jgi:hypothetical protein